MGLLEDILGEVAGSAPGETQPRQEDPLGSILGGLAGGKSAQMMTMLSALMMLIQQSGGLSAVMGMFRQKGMGQQADSWVGPGPNHFITGDQLSSVFGGEALSGIASQLGLSHGETTSAFAQLLPSVINQLTPQGQMPDNEGDVLSQALSMFGGAAE